MRSRGWPEAEAEGRRIATWVDAWRGEVYAALYEHGPRGRGARGCESRRGARLVSAARQPSSSVTVLGPIRTGSSRTAGGRGTDRVGTDAACLPERSRSWEALAAAAGCVLAATCDSAACMCDERTPNSPGTRVRPDNTHRILDRSTRRRSGSRRCPVRGSRSRSPTPGPVTCTRGSFRTARSATSSSSARPIVLSSASARSGSSSMRSTSTTWRSCRTCAGRGSARR